MWFPMLFAVASAYMLACAIQVSVPSTDNNIAVYNVIYGLGVSWLVLYAIIKLSKAPDISALWTISCHAGVVVFALLNQLNTHHTSPPAIVIITLITLITIWAGVKQIKEACRVHEWTMKAHAYVIFCGVYGIFLTMTMFKGVQFHFHMLHAITATLLSVFFTSTNADTVFHGFLMGVTVDGIAYVGSTQAMQYIRNTAPVKGTTLIITWGCIAVIAIFWAHLTARKSVKVVSIPLES